VLKKIRVWSGSGSYGCGDGDIYFNEMIRINIKLFQGEPNQ
jgi:hypothetical protein